MADARAKSVTELNQISYASNTDLVLISHNANAAAGPGAANSVAITLANLFGGVSANVTLVPVSTTANNVTTTQTFSFNGDLVANNVSLTNLELAIANTPANSTVTVDAGAFFTDGTYLYFAPADNTLKRVLLQSF